MGERDEKRRRLSDEPLDVDYRVCQKSLYRTDRDEPNQSGTKKERNRRFGEKRLTAGPNADPALEKVNQKSHLQQDTEIPETAIKIPRLSDEHFNIDDYFKVNSFPWSARDETSQSGTKKEVNKRFDETLTAGPNPCPALEKGQIKEKRLPSWTTFPTVKCSVKAGQIKEKRLPSSSPFPTGIFLEKEIFNKLRNMIKKGQINFLTSSVSEVNGFVDEQLQKFVDELLSCLEDMGIGEALVFATTSLDTYLNLNLTLSEQEPETHKLDIVILTSTHTGTVLSVGSSSLMDVTYLGEYNEALARELAHQMKYFTKEYFNLLPISMTVDDRLKENLKKKIEEMTTQQLLYYPRHRLEMDAVKYSTMVDAFVAIVMKSRHESKTDGHNSNNLTQIP